VWGYIDNRGRFAIAPRYAEAREFHEQLAEVKIDALWGYIDHEGSIVVPPAYRYAGEFREGLAAVEPHDRPGQQIGFIDRSGGYVISPRYEMVGTFRHGICLVELSEELAYIDHLGAVIWRGPFVDIGRVSEF
jgi:hypothetical protein